MNDFRHPARVYSPTCRLLDLRVHTKTNCADISVTLTIGPFASKGEIDRWLDRLQNAVLVHAQILVPASKGTYKFDRVYVDDYVNIRCVSAEVLQATNDPRGGPDTLVVYAPCEPVLFARSLHQLACSRVGMFG